MDFGFIPVAEASVVTLMKSINKVIINPIIFFLFALALVYFLFGLAQYLLNPENEEINKTSKSHMLYGVIGLFVMVAVFGIMNLILGTVGADKKIKIKDSGNYEIVIDEKTGDSYNLNSNSTIPTCTEGKYWNGAECSISTGTFSATDLDLRGGGNIDLTNVKTTRTTNFTENPFKIKYKASYYCWRDEIYGFAKTEYNAIKSVKDKAQADYKIVSISNKVPLNFGILTAYDDVAKTYHAWMDARGPINGGTNNDCNLVILEDNRELVVDDYNLSGFEFTTKNAEDFTNKDNSDFATKYNTDELFDRRVASGTDPILRLAKEIAIKKAFALMGIEIKSYNEFTIAYPTARLLEERYIKDPTTGEFEYFVAVELPKEDMPTRPTR